MSNSIFFGKYIPIDSPIHKCHPVTKILCTLLFILSNVFTFSLIVVISHIIFLILIIFISKIPGKYYIDSFMKMKYFLLTLLIINIIFSGSVWTGIFIVIKMIIIVSASSILLFTTSSQEIVYGLKTLLSPLAFLHISSTKLAYSLSLSIRFIPILLEQAHKILKSQISRGLDYSVLTLKEKIISLKSVLLPMFVLSMKRADILSEAMEVRLFNYNKPRSVFKSRKVSLKEKILIIVFTIEFIIVIVGKVLL